MQIVFYMQNERSVTNAVRHFSCVTEVVRGVFSPQKELNVVLAWKRRKFHLESDEVLCSPEGGFTQSLIILVDIECIDYS